MVGKKAVRHILVLIFYPLGYEMEINPQMEELIILTCFGITDQEPRSSLQPLVMDSLAQELIDAIIDHVPPCEARSCSLVARRWRKRGQQGYFSNIAFARECEVFRWYTNIPQDPDGIPSYAQNVEFHTISRWAEPTIFGRVLKCFRRVKSLTVYKTTVPPSEVDKVMACREFGKELTALTLIYPWSTSPTLAQLVLSFPKLQTLVIIDSPNPKPLSPIVQDKAWQRGPLQSMKLSGFRGEVNNFLAACGVTSCRIDLYLCDEMVERVIACSSETVSELLLRGVWLVENCVAEE